MDSRCNLWTCTVLLYHFSSIDIINWHYVMVHQHELSLLVVWSRNIQLHRLTYDYMLQIILILCCLYQSEYFNKSITLIFKTVFFIIQHYKIQTIIRILRRCQGFLCNPPSLRVSFPLEWSLRLWESVHESWCPKEFRCHQLILNCYCRIWELLGIGFALVPRGFPSFSRLLSQPTQHRLKRIVFMY